MRIIRDVALAVALATVVVTLVTIAILEMIVFGPLAGIVLVGLFALVRANLAIVLSLLGIATVWMIAGVVLDHTAARRARRIMGW